MCVGFTLARNSGFNHAADCGFGLPFSASSRVHRLWTSLSKNRTNFQGSVLASMALTQRLEFRQSQSLVMTPQLMQAIKLLQLSNLDLSAFVEEELERNPLLERASDGPKPPVAGEPTPERGANFPVRGLRAAYGDDGRQRAFRLARRRRRRLRARPGRLAEPRSRQPHRDRADPGYPPRQRVLRRAGRGRRAQRAGCRADRLHRMGRRRLQRRQLQSRSLRRRRGHARQSSRRTAGGGFHRRRRSA